MIMNKKLINPIIFIILATLFSSCSKNDSWNYYESEHSIKKYLNASEAKDAAKNIYLDTSKIDFAGKIIACTTSHTISDYTYSNSNEKQILIDNFQSSFIYSNIVDFDSGFYELTSLYTDINSDNNNKRNSRSYINQYFLYTEDKQNEINIIETEDNDHNVLKNYISIENSEEKSILGKIETIRTAISDLKEYTTILKRIQDNYYLTNYSSDAVIYSSYANISSSTSNNSYIKSFSISFKEDSVFDDDNEKTQRTIVYEYTFNPLMGIYRRSIDTKVITQYKNGDTRQIEDLELQVFNISSKRFLYKSFTDRSALEEETADFYKTDFEFEIFPIYTPREKCYFDKLKDAFLS